MNTRPLIKICGITSLRDALLAIDAGADMLGFIFVPGTPRFLSPEKACDILTMLPAGAVQTVGVFQNAEHAFIQRHLAQLPLDLIQLHGNEPTDSISNFGKPVIKRLPLTPDFTWESTTPFPHATFWLLDPPKGQLVSWESLTLDAPPAGCAPVLIAGGLTPDIVYTAMAACPWAAGVDVASGVESAPGQKDPDRLRAFCQKVRPDLIPETLMP